MKRNFLIILLLSWMYLPTFSQLVENVDGESAKLTNYTTSWIANDGGYEESHIPHDMLNMYVLPDGTAATICSWDEGGTNVAVFKDGKLISRPEGSGTGGWGRFSGNAVVLDEQYVYQLLTQHGCDGGNNELNINNKPQFPPCDKQIEWKTVRRYDIKTGKGAPFKGGYGYKGDMLIVCSEKERSLEGLAIMDGLLYVAVKGIESERIPDSIKIYNSKTMTYLKGYPVKGGVGLIYADNKKALWMMRGKEIVRMEAMNGKLLPQSLTVPPEAEAVSFTIDLRKERLLLPNRGKDLNIMIYDDIYKKPRFAGSFGVKGGVFSRTKEFIPGAAGPCRFSGPCATGVDDKGNIYIANTSVSGGRGAVLEAYQEKDKSLLWKMEGLIFTATADFDRVNTTCFYSPEKIHQIDFSKEGSRIDQLIAYTADPFLFPGDERVKKNGAFITSVFKRNIQGKSFLFVSDMYGGMLAGYRFNQEQYGYVAIPCLSIQNGNPDKKHPLSLWVDRNADGYKQPEEFHSVVEPNQYSMSFFIDHAGNMWRGTRQHGFFLWKLKELNEKGIPVYEEPRLIPLPKGFQDAKRIYYDPEKDELYLAGFSPKAQDQHDTWWALGSTIARCSNFMKRLETGALSFDDWKPDMLLYIPFHIEDGSGKDFTNAKAFTVEGDYIFVALARNGWITVYDRVTGDFIGRIEPGESVHKQSGWCDFNYSINACRQPDGSYLILQEENAFAKILCYHWKGAESVK
ncbi:hypothetical protein [Parabacteroides sp. AM08-6]|uniref:hypothetical protein n=1 Tax=Parabacteroides sp. AM08-6 TaxID=2292053 RepID=UPI0011C36E16|nr:hypothetical protein [Parabacteroides sp. AM08-6]